MFGPGAVERRARERRPDRKLPPRNWDSATVSPARARRRRPRCSRRGRRRFRKKFRRRSRGGRQAPPDISTPPRPPDPRRRGRGRARPRITTTDTDDGLSVAGRAVGTPSFAVGSPVRSATSRGPVGDAGGGVVRPGSTTMEAAANNAPREKGTPRKAVVRPASAFRGEGGKVQGGPHQDGRRGGGRRGGVRVRRRRRRRRGGSGRGTSRRVTCRRSVASVEARVRAAGVAVANGDARRRST